MNSEQIDRLIGEALRAEENAYAPYSDFTVGAALLGADGRVYHGCNIENASYSATNCAERSAIFKAVSEGHRDFAAIAVTGKRRGDGEEKRHRCAPCGVCLQVMAEFCDPESFEVILGISRGNYKVYKLRELLPVRFGGDGL